MLPELSNHRVAALQFGTNVPRREKGRVAGGLRYLSRCAGTSPPAQRGVAERRSLTQGVAKSQSVPKAAAGASAGAARTTSRRTGSWPGASIAIHEGTWILSKRPGGPKR